MYLRKNFQQNNLNSQVFGNSVITTPILSRPKLVPNWAKQAISNYFFPDAGVPSEMIHI